MKNLLPVFIVVALGVASSAQQKKAATPDQEWRTYNHDLAGTRFSPLTEINTGNVATLKQVAVNANTGEIAWQTRLGMTDALPEGKRNTGGSGSAGPTVTAGGLVFVAAADDRRLRAFDSKTGKELWVVKLTAPGNANPMTYQAKNGKQYVAIVATNHVEVFALP